MIVTRINFLDFPSPASETGVLVDVEETTRDLFAISGCLNSSMWEGTTCWGGNKEFHFNILIVANDKLIVYYLKNEIHQQLNVL